MRLFNLLAILKAAPFWRGQAEGLAQRPPKYWRFPHRRALSFASYLACAGTANERKSDCSKTGTRTFSAPLLLKWSRSR